MSQQKCQLDERKKSAVRLQSWWRGVHTRSQLCEVKQEYQLLFEDVEKNAKWHLFWVEAKSISKPLCYTNGNKPVPKNTEKLESDGTKSKISKFGKVQEETVNLDSETKVVVLPKVNSVLTDKKVDDINILVSPSKHDVFCENCEKNVHHSCESKCENAEIQNQIIRPQEHTEKPVGTLDENPALFGSSFTKEEDPSSADLKSEVPDTLLPPSHEEQLKRLKEEHKALTMELLWVHQAVNSRKHYLHLKSQIVPKVLHSEETL